MSLNKFLGKVRELFLQIVLASTLGSPAERAGVEDMEKI